MLTGIIKKITLTLLLPLVLPLAFGTEIEDLRFIAANNALTGSPEEEPQFEAGELKQTGEIKLTATLLLRFYKAYITKQDTSQCPFAPTCSVYAHQAINRYGILKGIIMASDRLQRCNALDMVIYPIKSGKYQDPVK